MNKWQEISDLEKKENSLYNKKTAFHYFINIVFFYAIIQLIGLFFFVTTNNGLKLDARLLVSIILFAPIVLIYLYRKKQDGKTKRTVNLFEKLILISYPIIKILSIIISSLIVGFIYQKNSYDLGTYSTLEIMKVLSLWIIIVIFYVIYKKTSKAFRLQYLNLEKTNTSK